ncbi:MAG: hypothetical protein QXP36_01475 [Conexivisphaerales archaeon]
MSVNKGTLDSVLSALKKLEAQFKPLMSQIQTILMSSRLGDEEVRIVENIKERLSEIEKAISTTLSYSYTAEGSQRTQEAIPLYMHGPPIIIRCKRWEDFKFQAANPEATSFLYKAEEKAFQVDALKGGRVYTFSGQIPGDIQLLRTWLARELNTEESRVVEGVLAIG